MELFRSTSGILTAMPHNRSAFFLALALFAFPSLAAITGSVMTPDGKPLAGARNRSSRGLHSSTASSPERVISGLQPKSPRG